MVIGVPVMSQAPPPHKNAARPERLLASAQAALMVAIVAKRKNRTFTSPRDGASKPGVSIRWKCVDFRLCDAVFYRAM